MENERTVWVQNIQDEIGVVLASCCEDHYFIEGMRHSTQEGYTTWPQTEFSLCCLEMNQSFIQV